MILISQMDSAHGTTLLWRWSWPGTFDELFSDLDGCGWRGGPVGRINNGPKCYAPSRCCCKEHADYTPECPWGVLVCSPDVVVCSPEKHGRLKRAGALAVGPCSLSSVTARPLSDALAALLSFAPSEPGEQVAQSRAVVAFEQILEARRNRVLLSGAVIAPVQWL